MAVLMLLIGLSEVVTGFTHTFLGLSTSHRSFSTVAVAAVGACYVAGGALLLTLRTWAAALALVLLLADIVGRVALAVTGYYPLTSFIRTAGISVGTPIAAFFAFSVIWKLASFWYGWGM